MNQASKLIKTKLGLLHLAEQLGNVSQACKVMGYSRDSFYRIRELYDTGGESALQEISRSKPILKNRVEAAVEEAVVKMALDYPAFGQLRACNELRKQGIFISAGGVRSVWLRHDLEVFDKRLKALEARVAQEGLILEAQLIAMERKKGSVWRDRNRAPGLSRFSGHLLRWKHQGCRPYLPADFH